MTSLCTGSCPEISRLKPAQSAPFVSDKGRSGRIDIGLAPTRVRSNEGVCPDDAAGPQRAAEARQVESND
jgi:hypothetical protein